MVPHIHLFKNAHVGVDLAVQTHVVQGQLYYYFVTLDK